jgi:hypothetical protein
LASASALSALLAPLLRSPLLHLLEAEALLRLLLRLLLLHRRQ